MAVAYLMLSAELPSVAGSSVFMVEDAHSRNYIPSDIGSYCCPFGCFTLHLYLEWWNFCAKPVPAELFQVPDQLDSGNSPGSE